MCLAHGHCAARACACAEAKDIRDEDRQDCEEPDGRAEDADPARPTPDPGGAPFLLTNGTMEENSPRSYFPMPGLIAGTGIMPLEDPDGATATAVALEDPPHWYPRTTNLALSGHNIAAHEFDLGRDRYTPAPPMLVEERTVVRRQRASTMTRAGSTSFRGVCQRCASGQCQCSFGGVMPPTPGRASLPLHFSGWLSPMSIQFWGAQYTVDASFASPVRAGMEPHSPPSSARRSCGPPVCAYCHKLRRGKQTSYAKRRTYGEEKICKPCADWERRSIKAYLTEEEFLGTLDIRRTKPAQRRKARQNPY